MYFGGHEEALTDEGLRQAVHFIQRFHYASLQDKNPVISARHNGYAYVVVEQIAQFISPERVKKLTGVDWEALKKSVLATERRYENLMFSLMEKLRARGYDLPDIVSGAALEKLLS